MNMNLQHLYYFWMVAREKGVSRACRKLCLAQSTVSGQIIQLERSFGKKLFHRDKNRLVLSEDGEKAFQYAAEIFSASEALWESLREGAVETRPRFRLGVDALVTRQVALRCLNAIYGHFPKCLLVIREGSGQDFIRDLREHRLDAVLCEQPARWSGMEDLRRVEVAALQIFFVAASKLARHVRSFPAGLSNIPLLLPTPESSLRSRIDEYLARYGVNARTAGEFHDAEFMRLLALEGVGAAPLHEISAAADLKSGRLLRLGHGPTGIVKSIWLVTTERSKNNPIAKWLAEHFRISSRSL